MKTSEAVAVDEDSNAPYAEAVATLQYAPLSSQLVSTNWTRLWIEAVVESAVSLKVIN